MGEKVGNRAQCDNLNPFARFEESMLNPSLSDQCNTGGGAKGEQSGK